MIKTIFFCFGLFWCCTWKWMLLTNAHITMTHTKNKEEKTLKSMFHIEWKATKKCYYKNRPKSSRYKREQEMTKTGKKNSNEIVCLRFLYELENHRKPYDETEWRYVQRTCTCWCVIRCARFPFRICFFVCFIFWIFKGGNQTKRPKPKNHFNKMKMQKSLLNDNDHINHTVMYVIGEWAKDSIYQNVCRFSAARKKIYKWNDVDYGTCVCIKLHMIFEFEQKKNIQQT